MDDRRVTTTLVSERAAVPLADQAALSSVNAFGRTFDQGFGELFDIAYRVAYRILGSREDACDVAQEALARAERRWTRLADHPEGWVATVSSNLAIGVWRRARRQWATNAPAAAQAADGYLAERLDLVQALRSLPRRQRQVVVLGYLADRPEAEGGRPSRLFDGFGEDPRDAGPGRASGQAPSVSERRSLNVRTPRRSGPPLR